MVEGLDRLYWVIMHILSAGKVVWRWWARPRGRGAVSWVVVTIFIVAMFLSFT